MRTQRLRHVIDFLFAVALFGVFLISSVMVIAAGTGAYRNITAKSQEDYTLRTSLSYVCEKLRQADSEGALTVGTVGGSTALILEQEYSKASYVTYIYEYNGSLCELFTSSEAAAEPAYGTALLELSDFQVERLADALYRVSLATDDGMEASLLLHPFSTNPEKTFAAQDPDTHGQTTEAAMDPGTHEQTTETAMDFDTHGQTAEAAMDSDTFEQTTETTSDSDGASQGREDGE